MSQQINLLRPKARTLGSAVWPLAGAAVVLLALLGYRQSLVSTNATLQEAATAGEQKLGQIRNAVLLLQKQKEARGNPAALTAEIAALRPRAEAVSQIVKDIGNGNLGSPEGYARYFRTVAGVSEDGLWITGVAVAKGGNSVTISGRALKNESVMQYARRLNEAFSPYGVRFNSLEMTPENVSTPGVAATPGAPALSTVVFKLS